MTAYPYEAGYEPPAPVVPIRVAPPHRDTAVLLHALVDSGADLTVVPAGIRRQLELSETDRVTVRAAGGTRSSAGVYAAQVELDGISELVEVLALGEETLVGRNLLRALLVTLDGPAGEVRLGRT